MRYVSLGTLRASQVGFGCMGMSEGYGTADPEECVRILQKAVELGINFFDTADIYGIDGHNERLVSRALGAQRDKILISTKCGLVRTGPGFERKIDARPAHIKAACERSLQNLGVNHVDMYFLHRMDPAVPIEDSVGAMSDLVRRGLVREIGLCEVSPATLRRASAVHRIAGIQCEYSLWTRDPEKNGVLDACRDLDIRMIAYSPLGRGFLAGAVPSSPVASDDLRTTMPRFQQENIERNLALLTQLKLMVARRDWGSASQTALAWVLSQPAEIMAIPGMDRMPHLLENIGALNLQLSKADLSDIAATFPQDEVAGGRYAANFRDWTNM